MLPTAVGALEVEFPSVASSADAEAVAGVDGGGDSVDIAFNGRRRCPSSVLYYFSNLSAIVLLKYLVRVYFHTE